MGVLAIGSIAHAHKISGFQDTRGYKREHIFGEPLFEPPASGISPLYEKASPI
jgi:hypothetical protein